MRKYVQQVSGAPAWMQSHVWKKVCAPHEVCVVCRFYFDSCAGAFKCSRRRIDCAQLRDGPCWSNMRGANPICRYRVYQVTEAKPCILSGSQGCSEALLDKIWSQKAAWSGSRAQWFPAHHRIPLRHAGFIFRLALLAQCAAAAQRCSEAAIRRCGWLGQYLGSHHARAECRDCAALFSALRYDRCSLRAPDKMGACCTLHDRGVVVNKSKAAEEQ